MEKLGSGIPVHILDPQDCINVLKKLVHHYIIRVIRSHIFPMFLEFSAGA
jgi:hypothetical protein